MLERKLILDKSQTKVTMETAGIPCASLAYVSNLGNIYTDELNVPEKPPTDQETSTTVFGAASLSKPVFAYLVLKLIESEKYTFDLETKLNDILPFDQFCEQNKLTWEKSDKDTRERIELLNAKMVLSHTTGFNLFKQVPIKSQFEPGKGYVYSNLAMYYLQKMIEKLVNNCDLIQASSPPNKETLSDLPIISNAAYVRSGDQLFYANKADNTCIEIKIEQDKLKQFDESLNSSNKTKTLSDGELKQASLISGHTPNNLTFQMLAKAYVFDPIDMKNSSFYREYELDFMPESNEMKLRSNTLYLKTTENGLNYAVLGLDGERKSDTISWERLEGFPKEISNIILAKEKYLPTLLAHTANAGHTTSREASAPNSLYTTAEDYANFVRYWLNDKNTMMQKAFHDPVLHMMEEDGKINDQWGHEFISADDMKHVACGLGWDLETNDQGKVIRAYKTGDMNQWRGQVAIDFEKNTVIVYFANSPSGHILADQIITPNVELKHGHNYFFQKFGFVRNIENGYDLALMSEATSPQNGKIYLETTKNGLQVGVKGLSEHDEFEKHIIPWFKLPQDFPKDPLKIIELCKSDLFIPTLLLEEARMAKIDAYLDSQTATPKQPKDTSEMGASLANSSTFFSQQQASSKSDNHDNKIILVNRKRGG